MKRLEKIKLTSMSKEELETKQLKFLMGGYGTDCRGNCDSDLYCNCGCVSPPTSSSANVLRDS